MDPKKETASSAIKQIKDQSFALGLLEAIHCVEEYQQAMDCVEMAITVDLLRERLSGLLDGKILSPNANMA